jgi:hypothetical protein
MGTFKFYLRPFNSMENIKSNHDQRTEHITEKINRLNKTNIIFFELH